MVFKFKLFPNLFLNHGDGESLASYLRDKENLYIEQLGEVK